MSGPMILGLNLEVFIMLASGIFYLICASFLWKPFKKEKNELIGALFAFLIYQALSMFFMGLEMETKNILYSNIASISVFIGSVYMLKFPFSFFPKIVSKILFFLSLAGVIALFLWFIETPEKELALMNFTAWYDIVINGLVVGGSIITFAFLVPERWMKIKAAGGAGGIVSCCVISGASMLGGALVASTVFQFLAPVLIICSLVISNKKKRQVQTQ